MISIDPSTRVAFCNIASSLAFHTGPPELCLQIMIHLCAAWVDGIFGCVSFIKYLLVQPMVLWNHQTILEPESAFLIHAKTVNFRVTSQHRGEGHIILSHDRGYSNTRSFPRDTDNRQVVVVSLVAQAVRDHIRLTRMIVNLKIIVLD
jgi:hypothetical protein